MKIQLGFFMQKFYLTLAHPRKGFWECPNFLTHQKHKYIFNKYKFWLKPVGVVFNPRPKGRGNGCFQIIIFNAL
jgi:hypothetical protein